jgi:cyclic pyranopterin phosphate synthase
MKKRKAQSPEPRPRTSTPARLSHVDRSGRVRMVDVGSKQHTPREAVARGRITVGAAALREIRAGRVAKGDPLQTARLAGILAAKQTSALIPLCHPLPISYVDVEIKRDKTGYLIESRVGTIAQTGVEMEALTAVAVAALTIYDMLKALDKTMVIGEICVAEKRGGRSGEYRRSAIVDRPSSIVHRRSAIGHRRSAKSKA